MKKLILIALIALGVTAQSQTTVPLKVAGTVSIANTPTNVNTTTTLSATDRGYIDGIEGYFRSLNNKMDSLLSGRKTTTLSFTIASGNAGAVTTPNSIGTGNFTLSALPAGNWRLREAIATTSLYVSTEAFKILLFNGGSSNIAATAGDNTSIALTVANGTEWKEVINFLVASFQAGGNGTVAFHKSVFLSPSTSAGQPYSGQVFSGVIKGMALYGANYTPTANFQLMVTLTFEADN